MSSPRLHTWTWSIPKSHLIWFLYPNCTKARRLSSEISVQRWEGNLGWSSSVSSRTQEASPAFVLLRDSKIIITVLITEARLLKISLEERWCNGCFRMRVLHIQTIWWLLKFDVYKKRGNDKELELDNRWLVQDLCIIKHLQIFSVFVWFVVAQNVTHF